MLFDPIEVIVYTQYTYIQQILYNRNAGWNMEIMGTDGDTSKLYKKTFIFF